MKLFIANTTKQRHNFTFRALESKAPRHIPIAPGTQSVVLNNATTDDIQNLIEQHEVYGLIDSRTIDSRTTFIGLCYSIDKPVASSVIEKAMRDNDDHLIREGHQRRQHSVSALHNQLEENGEKVDEFEVHVEQAGSRLNERGDDPTVNESIKSVGRSAGRKKRGA